jgi:uncharacterized protein (TIGR03435 family)
VWSRMRELNVAIGFAGLFLFATSNARCQAQPPAAQPPVWVPPRFEVASVRLAGEDSKRSERRIQTEPGSLTTRGLPLRACILWAYQQPIQIIAPDWINQVALDIVAKAATPVGDEQLYLMLRTLLEERMGVQAHFERRETPVYAITIAKGGPKFTKSTAEVPLVLSQDKDGALVIQHFSMNELAQVFSRQFDRPVVDATGMKGRYDGRIDMSTNAAERIEYQSALITSMEEQMGLNIQARKEEVDVLIVDHAERTPTDN